MTSGAAQPIRERADHCFDIGFVLTNRGAASKTHPNRNALRARPS
jgi:hypothetical protein